MNSGDWNEQYLISRINSIMATYEQEMLQENYNIALNVLRYNFQALNNELILAFGGSV